MARLQSLSTTTPPSGGDTVSFPESPVETTNTPGASSPSVSHAAETTTSPAAEKRRPLTFEPEPTQRMVVVRRRKRRRSRKVNKAERAASGLRFVLLGVVIILLLVAVSGQHFAQALLEQLKDAARPIKSVLQAPKLEVVALVIAALILLYMMPGVESTVRRWLGINSRPKQKTR